MDNQCNPLIVGGVLYGSSPDGYFSPSTRRPANGSPALLTSGFATPSTYAVNGRQYVVIASGGGKVRRPTSSAFVAFALPE